jgi:hypothetical protein
MLFNSVKKPPPDWAVCFIISPNIQRYGINHAVYKSPSAQTASVNVNEPDVLLPVAPADAQH